MSDKTISKLLSFLGWLFFIAGILAACYSIILLATLNFADTFGDEGLFIPMILGSCFIFSWGIALFGIKKILNK